MSRPAEALSPGSRLYGQVIGRVFNNSVATSKTMKVETIHSPVGIEFLITPAVGPLARYAHSLWGICMPAQARLPVAIRELPSGCLDVIFSFGDQVPFTGAQQPAGSPSACCLVRGPILAPVLWCLEQRIEAIGVRFRPGGAYWLIQQDISLLVDGYRGIYRRLR